MTLPWITDNQKLESYLKTMDETLVAIKDIQQQLKTAKPDKMEDSYYNLAQARQVLAQAENWVNQMTTYLLSYSCVIR